MRDLPELAALLVGPDPRLAADRTLGFLIARSRASGGAVLQLREGEPVPFTTRDLSAARLAEAASLWRDAQVDLVAGKIVHTPDGVLVPLRDEGTLVGALYLEDVGAFDEAGVGASLLTLTKAVGPGTTSRPRHLPAGRAGGRDPARADGGGAGPERVEHLQGRAYPWRGAPDRVPAPGALRDPPKASAQEPRLMAHDKSSLAVVNLASLATLAGLVARGRARQCWSFVAYLSARS